MSCRLHPPRLALLLALLLIATSPGGLATLGPRPAHALAPPAQEDLCPERNDSFKDACALPGSTALAGYIGGPDDVDAYVFQVAGPVQVKAVLSGLPGDYDLHLYTPAIELLQESTAEGTGDEAVDVQVDAPGSYFLFVNSGRGEFSSAAPYNLQLQVVALAAPPPPRAVVAANSVTCPVEMAGGFAQLWRRDPVVRGTVGCALEPETSANVAVQYFPRGALYWWGNERAIYVFFDRAAGAWQRFDEPALPEGEPTWDCPSGTFVPRRGFGRLLAADAAVANAIGYCATAEEEGGLGAAEPFETGFMLYMPWTPSSGEKRIWVLSDGGTFKRYRDFNPD